MTRIRMASDFGSLPLSVVAVSEFRLVIVSPEQKKKQGGPPGGQPGIDKKQGWPQGGQPPNKTRSRAGRIAASPAGVGRADRGVPTPSPLSRPGKALFPDD